MNVGSTNNSYLNMVQQATRYNTLSTVAQARQSGATVDVEQLQTSNQQLRNDAREVGVQLYSQQLVKQQVETYSNTSSSNDDTSSSVYTFDAAAVNDNLQMAQKRSLGVQLYENLNTQEQPDFTTRPVTLPVNVYV